MANIIKQQQAIKSAMMGLASSLASIDESVKDWPVKPTGNENDDNQEFPVSLDKYVEKLSSFGECIESLETQNLLQNLINLRNQVTEARKKFNATKTNITNVGTEAVLDDAMNLRVLLAHLRGAEIEFFNALVNQWKDAAKLLGKV
ncbi:hypothetical protein GPJ56_004914 [Histomonas meleagridis]|uniref:uncharacterized protein n=1 Tax=Histomonas meleagridis TaxID=135588 RepID=UPI00355A4A3C|nr:hypothetical protein GPJ56_004914 [Histomonas meleagridis]KAH0806302.1 hypothetical protein GO595_000990 [Histomonas meleagridis]